MLAAGLCSKEGKPVNGGLLTKRPGDQRLRARWIVDERGI
jgi:hypothetical protein